MEEKHSVKVKSQQSSANFTRFPDSPLFRNLAIHNPADIDADQGSGFASRLVCAMSRHACNHLISHRDLIFDGKNNIRIEVVEGRYASYQTSPVPITRGNMTNVIQMDNVIQSG